ncbi:DEKNAAC101844 [Brettanomyces naardenensis]|uniref:DEKNAAC101844 n=1 Tax=Brettanomyces naardenensis TaxID=13370 RepID=A0A448YJ63_BRENA|nr:DEKNAAC101844 [Brettanomyces naardenensis]
MPLRITFVLYIILCISYSLSCVSAVQLSRTIPLSGKNAAALNTRITQRRHELNSLKNSLDTSTPGFFGSGVSKSKLKEIDQAVAKLKSAVNEYLICNSCLRYYVGDFVDFAELDQSPGGYTGLLIAINLKLEDTPDDKLQSLNMNVMDEQKNILRRKNDIRDRNIHMAIDFPVISKDRESYSDQYIDVCFENLKVDRSWNSHPRGIDSSMSIDFGLPSIASNYEKSNQKMSEIQKEFIKAEGLIESIVQKMYFDMAKSETELRDVNEDTYSKQTMLFVATIVTLCVSTLGETYWLKRYLETHHLV